MKTIVTRCHKKETMRTWIGFLLIFALPLFWYAPATAQVAGDLDLTFGDEGSARVGLFAPADVASLGIAPVPGQPMYMVSGALDRPDDFVLTLARFTNAGLLDTNFGNQGIVTTDITSWWDLTALAVQPDGKALIAATYADEYEMLGFRVARFKANGELDVGFGNQGTGIVDTPFPNTDAIPITIALQPDGKILVGGAAEDEDGNAAIALARYRPDGSLDPTFGPNQNGRVFATRPGYYSAAFAIAIQPDSKIVLSGVIEDMSASAKGTPLAHRIETMIKGLEGADTSIDMLIARFLPDGNPDTGFGEDQSGYVALDFQLDVDVGLSIALQNDGYIVAAGYAYIKAYEKEMAVVRLTLGGILDDTFGNGGQLVTDLPGESSHIRSLLIQPDGNIIGAGGIESPGIWQHAFAAVRYLPDGALDPSFAKNGVFSMLDYGFPFYESWDALLLPDSRLIALHPVSMGALCLNTDGSMDTGFGDEGTGMTSAEILGPTQDYFAALALAPETDAILLGGTVDRGVGLARLDANGLVDPSFGQNGYILDYIDDEGHTLTDLLILHNGRIIAASTMYYTFGGLLMTAYTADGERDLDFGFPGMGLATEEQLFPVGSLAPHGETGFLAPGYLLTTPTHDFGLIRYNQDGTPDAEFGPTGDGRVTVDFQNQFDKIEDLIVQKDGAIILGGYSFVNTRSERDILVARLASDGSIDTNFGDNGLVVADFGLYDNVLDLGLQSDGKLIVLMSNAPYLLRFHADGTPDPTFQPAALGANSMLVQPDDYILIAGFTTDTSSDAFTLARLNPDGSLDTRFGSAPEHPGIVISNPFDAYASFGEIALQKNGDILVGGTVYTESDVDFGIARYRGAQTGTAVEPERIVTAFRLEAGFPNPAAREATIVYTLPYPAEVTLSVYDVLGREVATLVEGQQDAGRHEARFDVRALPDGLYIYRLETPEGHLQRTIVRLD